MERLLALLIVFSGLPELTFGQDQNVPQVRHIGQTVPIGETGATMKLDILVIEQTGKNDGRNVINFFVKVDNSLGGDPITPKASWSMFSQSENFTFELKDEAGFSYSPADPSEYKDHQIEFSGKAIDPGDFSSGVISIVVPSTLDVSGFRIRFDDGQNRTRWITIP